MGTKLSTASAELKNSPVVNVRGAKGEYFIGTWVGHKTVANGYKNDKGEEGSHQIYTFTIEDTDMGTQIKQGKEYIDTEVSEGMEVVLFAPTRLHNALRQAEKGMKLKITYLGKGKATKFGGKPHDYEVEIL